MSKSVWPVIGMAGAIGLAAVVAAGATSNSKRAEAAPIAAMTPTPTPEPLIPWKVPHGATEADALAMLDWMDQNEKCRGSSDAATIDRECPKRDATEKRLATRGWCWDYPDKPAADADWHRCTEDAKASAPAAVSRVETLKAEVEPYYAAAVESQVLRICGIRSGDWSGRIIQNVNILNDQLAQRLSEAERTEMGNWQRDLQHRIESHMVPGGDYNRIKCRELAASTLPDQLDAIDWKLTGGFH